MDGSFGFLEVKPMLFGSINNGGKGDLLVIFFLLNGLGCNCNCKMSKGSLCSG